MRNKKGLNTGQIVAIVVLFVVASVVAILQLTGKIDILLDQRDFCPGIGDQVLCGICNKDIKLSDNPYAGQCRMCPAGTTCSGDVCGDIKCLPVDNGQNIILDLSGTWEGQVFEVLHGPEGSFPPGCGIQQNIQLDIKQNGNTLSGTVSTVLTGTSCSPVIPASMFGTKATSQLSGTVTGSSATFSSEDRANLGAVDFTATFSEGRINENGIKLDDLLSGEVVTCHSPDARCTCESPDPLCPGGFDTSGMPRPGRLETINWWTGDFTATRTK